MPFLTAGETAPDFTLPDQDGKDVTLSSLRGQPVLIYFYPRDDTPGCTTQACDIRDRWAEYEAAGVHVLGVSPDSAASHVKFRGKYDLPHTLLADTEHVTMEAYGAWGEKTLYGKKSIGVIRSSVLIDADGVVAKVWKRSQAKKHADHTLAAIAALS